MVKGGVFLRLVFSRREVHHRRRLVHHARPATNERHDASDELDDKQLSECDAGYDHTVLRTLDRGPVVVMECESCVGLQREHKQFARRHESWPDSE